MKSEEVWCACGTIGIAPAGARRERGTRIATACGLAMTGSFQCHKVNCSPDRGSSSTDDIEIPLPTKGQAFCGGPDGACAPAGAGKGQGMRIATASEQRNKAMCSRKAAAHRHIALFFLSPLKVKPSMGTPGRRLVVGIRIPLSLSCGQPAPPEGEPRGGRIAAVAALLAMTEFRPWLKICPSERMK